jgi:hypothetical protein
VVGPTKTNPRRFSTFVIAFDSAVTDSRSCPERGAGREAGSGANDQISSSSVSPSARIAVVAWALVIAASIFLRLRTIPASPSSRATSSSPYSAIRSTSKPSNARRKFSRLRRIVSQERPDWNASRVSRSNSATSPCSGRPHSSSW